MVEQDGRLSAQVAVLGSLLIQPELVGQALEKIRPEDFLTPKCRMVFQAIKSLYTEGRPTDPVTVRGRLGGKDGDSWTEYLLELMDLTPTAANVWEYAALMREQARMAKVAELGILLQAARDLDGARGYIAQLNELLVERRGVQRMDMAQMLLTFTDRHSGTPVEYMTWGLPKIDAGTYAEMGDMVVLGGYPSAGKTALAVSMAYHQAKDRRVGFYSLETNQYKLADRLMANLAGIEMPTIKRNEITGEQWQRLADRSDRIRARKLELIEASGMSAQDIQADALAHRYEIVYIDYLQLMSGSGGRKNESRQQEISEISRSLKALARELNVPVVALSQLSRAVESRTDHRPMLSDLRESGAIEQDADVVMFIYRDDYYKKDSDMKGIAEIIIAKQRNGPIGTVNLVWLPDYTKFMNLEQERR